jgi:hypothetical protein
MSSRSAKRTQQITKDFDSARPVPDGILISPGTPGTGEKDMQEKTCAACDYKLDDKAIRVTVGGKTVEVCCEECAQKLREAHASATAAKG